MHIENMEVGTKLKLFSRLFDDKTRRKMNEKICYDDCFSQARDDGKRQRMN